MNTKTISFTDCLTDDGRLPDRRMLVLSGLPVLPVCLARLTNSVFGSDHMLLFDSKEGGEEGLLFPALLSFDEGALLEAALGNSGVPDNTIVVAGQLLCHDLFSLLWTEWQLALKLAPCRSASLTSAYMEKNSHFSL